MFFGIREFKVNAADKVFKNLAYVHRRHPPHPAQVSASSHDLDALYIGSTGTFPVPC